VSALKLPNELQEALVTAARFHDLGKKREVWQRSIGNPDPTDWYAKSGRDWEPRDICPDYRHEFGSLLDVERQTGFQEPKARDEGLDLAPDCLATDAGGRTSRQERRTTSSRMERTQEGLPAKCRSVSLGYSASMAAGDWRIWNRCFAPPIMQPAQSHPS